MINWAFLNMSHALISNCLQNLKKIYQINLQEELHFLNKLLNNLYIHPPQSLIQLSRTFR